MTRGPELLPNVRSVRTGAAEIVWSTEVVAADAEWTIEEDRHVVIVHLDGVLRGLRTELAGAGTSRREPSAGEIWSIPAGRRYRGCAKGGTIRYATLFVPPRAGPLVPQLPVMAPMAGVRDDLMHTCVRELETLATPPGCEPGLYAQHLLTTLVLHLDHRYGDGRQRGRWCEPGALTVDASERLRTFVTANLDRELHVADMAAAANVPAHALTRAVRETFGSTPWQFVIAQRLAQARRLLRDGMDDLTSIALRCGFSSHAHFTRCARQHWGTTPSRMRRGDDGPGAE